jgi:hypothetical protein
MIPFKNSNYTVSRRTSGVAGWQQTHATLSDAYFEAINPFHLREFWIFDSDDFSLNRPYLRPLQPVTDTISTLIKKKNQSPILSSGLQDSSLTREKTEAVVTND